MSEKRQAENLRGFIALPAKVVGGSAWAVMNVPTPEEYGLISFDFGKLEAIAHSGIIHLFAHHPAIEMEAAVLEQPVAPQRVHVPEMEIRARRIVADDARPSSVEAFAGVSPLGHEVHPDPRSHAARTVRRVAREGWHLSPWRPLLDVAMVAAVRSRPLSDEEDERITEAWTMVWRGAGILEGGAASELVRGLARQPLPLLLANTFASRDRAISSLTLICHRHAPRLPGRDVANVVLETAGARGEIGALEDPLAMGGLAVAAAVLSAIPLADGIRDSVLSRAVTGLESLASREQVPASGDDGDEAEDLRRRRSMGQLLAFALACGVVVEGSDERRDRVAAAVRNLPSLLHGAGAPPLRRILDYWFAR